MKALTTATRPATCTHDGPLWCPAILDADDIEHHVHSTFAITPVIHTISPRDGQPSSVCIDIEQAHTDPRPVIVVHGTAIDETFALDDAKRIHALLGACLAAAEQAVTA